MNIQENPTTRNNLFSNWKKPLGATLLILAGIVCLAIAGVGLASFGARHEWWSGGALSNLSQIDAISMMSGGSISTMASMIFLAIFSVHSTKKNPVIPPPPPSVYSPLPAAFYISNPEIAETISRSHFVEAATKETFPVLGKEVWKNKFNVNVEEPPLPDNIERILNSLCPIANDEKTTIRQTHTLVLIPKTIDGRQLTLRELQDLSEQQTNKISLSREAADYTTETITSSYWVLMTKSYLPHSYLDCSSSNYKYSGPFQEIVGEYKDYQIPGILEITATMMLERSSSKASGTENFNPSLCCKETDSKGELFLTIGYVPYHHYFDIRSRFSAIHGSTDPGLHPHIRVRALRKL